ncbi:MAG: RES family NAD+ phosphorylase [Chitinophagaceae bacterium]
MEVFRLARRPYAAPLSGQGAALKGARWNSIGIELVYTAINRSLAMAEVAVHCTLATLPEDYVMVTIHIPDDVAVQKIGEQALPQHWKDFPHPLATQKIGDDFVHANQYCLLIIPSAVTQGDFNVLINPYHKDFAKIKIIDIAPFPFDKRIFQ